MTDKARGDGWFDRLCGEIAPRMKSLAVRLTGSESAADDIVQEAALKVWRKLAGLPADANVSAYFARTVANLCKDNHRAKARRAPGQIPLDLAQNAADGNDELGRQLREAIATLPAKQREALVLRYFEGLGYAEMAAALGCRDTAARKRVSSARETLRKRLERLEEFAAFCRREDP